MTDAKRSRRDRIASVAEGKTGKRTMTYWLSRDRAVDGSYSLYVDVWLLRPERVDGIDGSTYYRLRQGHDTKVKTGDGPKPAHYGTWTLAQAQIECHTYPEDDRQVIRNGPDVEPEIYKEDDDATVA